MNLAIRKLALLEKAIADRENCLKGDGYTTNPSDAEIKRQIASIRVKIRAI